MATLSHTMKRVLLVVGPVSMPVETLAIEALGIGAQTVDALLIVGTVRVKGDLVKKGVLIKGCELSARWLR